MEEYFDEVERVVDDVDMVFVIDGRCFMYVLDLFIGWGILFKLCMLCKVVVCCWVLFL